MADLTVIGEYVVYWGNNKPEEGDRYDQEGVEMKWHEQNREWFFVNVVLPLVLGIVVGWTLGGIF